MNHSEHSQEYIDYINSDKWHALVNRLKEKRGNRCERCGNRSMLEGHHKNYDRLGHELDSDVEIVCTGCHKIADKERVEWTERRNYQRRVDAWARKVYSDEWFTKYNFDQMFELFEKWLVNKEDDRDWIEM